MWSIKYCHIRATFILLLYVENCRNSLAFVNTKTKSSSNIAADPPSFPEYGVHQPVLPALIGYLD
jgi:hypothetical protein